MVSLLRRFPRFSTQSNSNTLRPCMPCMFSSAISANTEHEESPCPLNVCAIACNATEQKQKREQGAHSIGSFLRAASTMSRTTYGLVGHQRCCGRSRSLHVSTSVIGLGGWQKSDSKYTMGPGQHQCPREIDVRRPVLGSLGAW